MEYQRKLASVQRIAEVKAIPDADRIVAYRVNGWWIVDQKDKYQVNDLIVFCEVDSFVPTEIAPFLSKGKEPRVYKGIAGERLRTIKLKKQLSQGLILPFDTVISAFCDITFDNGEELCEVFYEGADVTELLGIIKHEPEPEFRHADAKGTFPAFLRKSDQERIQNCFRDVQQDLQTKEWEVTEKLEGSSHTSYFYNGEFGVCSRNLELKESTDNTFWAVAIKYNLKEKLSNLGRNLMLQGEMVGPGIQGNIYALDEYKLFIYDIFDINKQEYLSPDERHGILMMLDIDSVPIIQAYYTDYANSTCDQMLGYADGKSVLNPKVLREGLVYKLHSDQRVSFKTVSNQYLLGEK